MAAKFTLHQTDDPTAYHAAVYDFLIADEARNNLILSILQRLPNMQLEEPPLMAWMTDADDMLAAVALRTPPHNLLIANSSLPDAVSQMGAEMAAPGIQLSGINTETGLAQRFTAAFGATVARDLPQGVYQLTEVNQPANVVGGYRRANEAGRALLVGWMAQFTYDALPQAQVLPEVHDSTVTRLLNQSGQGLYVWEVNGEAVSMAAINGITPNGRRISYVFTPAQQRGRGYASALTAAVSQKILDDGLQFCFLYTDLANPTSNKIYQAIGYRHVCDVIDITYVEA